ncbi:MAG: hypothetical protein KAV00_04600 [Phycisphaerae bacterium]|nr:hypothetical protein [Phycisphaerae bacterium]
MALTTRQLVKDVIGTEGTGRDALIDHYVDVASQWIANHCRRHLEREVGRVEYPRGGGTFLQLACYPIEAVSELKQAIDLDYDDADALVENEDFVIDQGVGVEANVGVIQYRFGKFYDGPKVVRVTYTGGYWTGDVADLPEGARALPAPIRGPATQMAVHLFRNREKFGSRHISVGDMSVSEVLDGMLKVAAQQLAAYVNWS